MKTVLVEVPAPKEVLVPDVSGKRKRKPALDATEFVLESKRKKTDPVSSGSAKKKKPESDESRLPKKGQNLTKIIVPEIVRKNEKNNSVSSASDQISASQQKSFEDLKSENVASPKEEQSSSSKPILKVPQITSKNSQENSRKSEKENSDMICDIDENSGSVESENREEDSAFSSEFLEDEFLMDSIPPKGTSHQEVLSHEIKIEEPATPQAKGKRGRPSKKSLEERMSSTPKFESVQPSTAISESVQSTSEFATPTEKPKRGRKKKDPNAISETPEPEIAVYESAPGKRIRKKIDYRELSGETSATSVVNKTSLSETSLAEMSLNETSLNETSLIGSSISETPTQPPKSKRGRKRKIDISTLSDNIDTDTSFVDIKSPKIFDVKSAKVVICGKCQLVFKTNQTFHYHIAAAHGGVVSLFYFFFSL